MKSLTAALLLLAAAPAAAHDFYEDLRSPRGRICCGENDCKPYPHRTTGGELDYEVLINGKWIPIPRDIIVEMGSPDGQVHVCCLNKQCDMVIQPPAPICAIIPWGAV